VTRSGAVGPPELPLGRSTRIAGSVLPVVGIVLFAVSTAFELSNLHPRAELSTSVAAGAVFLLATAFSRGGASHVFDLRARMLVGAALSTLLAVSALWQATERSASPVLFLLIPVSLLFATAALAVREAAVQRRRAHLREVRARLEGEEAERRRWVRELHDDTLQELAAVMVVLGAATAGNDPQARERGIADAREVIGRQIHALRRLIAQVRPLALDALGLNAAIEDLGRHARELSGIDIQVNTQDLPRLATDTETSLYRIVQEALTNAVRHSGATRITVETRSSADGLEVSVHDDGRGHPPAGIVQGHGLAGMHERADALGADLDLSDAPGGGTLVRLRLPYPDNQPS